MLEILGIIGGNILSLPGILGMALGMTTRRVWLGTALGVLVGLFETAAFVHWNLAAMGAVELVIAVLIGALAGALGTAIRIRGATV